MRTTVLTNIYNEEYLLPFWLEHHKHVFDHGIIVDYWSTDKSVELCRKICPTWEVRTTKNTQFRAADIDKEFMELENSIEGIKVILNTTEFLLATDPLSKIFSESVTVKNPQISFSAIMYGVYSMLEKHPTTLENLLTGILEDDVRCQFEYYRGRRQVHNYPTGKYHLGRHDTYNPNIETNRLAILWLGYYPWNESMITRKLQVKTHIPESDVKNGHSFHHFYSREKFIKEHDERYEVSKPLQDVCPHLYTAINLHLEFIKNGYMHYSLIGRKNHGLTNQLQALIKAISDAYGKKEKVVIVDHFLDDFEKEDRTPISQIFNLDKMNAFLKKEYNILIFDKYDIKFTLDSITYGHPEKGLIDLTDYCLKHYYRDNYLYIRKNKNINDINGDPCHNVVKNLYIKYTINNYTIEEEYPEYCGYLQNDVYIEFLHSNYEFQFGCVNQINKDIFKQCLQKIEYTDEFVEKAVAFYKGLSLKEDDKINIIHLRLEDDSVYWSKTFHKTMTFEEYKKSLETKYIQLIQKNLNKTDKLILLSASLSNGVVDFLQENQYNYTFTEKHYTGREKNAIVDVLVSKYCNNVFIGNECSTFSYYIQRLLNKSVKKVFINLDNLSREEMVFYVYPDE